MRFMGWDIEHWKKGVARQDEGITYDVTKRLAGNAFNGFAFWPIFAAAISIIGLVGITPVSTAQPSPPDDDTDSLHFLSD